MATGRGPRRHWANGPSQAIAGYRYVGIVSDLDVPGLAEFKSALSTISAAGPHTRLGLTPEPGRRMWTYDPAAPLPVHQLPDEVAGNGYAAILQHVRRRPGPRRTLEFLLAPRQFAFDADHGLGDGRFVVDLISAIFAVAGGRTPPWVINDDTRLALPRTLIKTFGMHPSRARRAWKHAVTLRSAHTVVPQDPSGGELLAWSPSFAVSVAHVDADAEAAVNEWRRANTGKAGSAAVWLYIARQALHAAGLPMTNEVMATFDCRRYAPLHATANGNFVTGIEIPLAVTETVSTAITHLRECTSSAVPLAAMGVLSTRALLRAGRMPTPPPSRTASALANVTYTDMGHITAFDDLPWHSQGNRDHTGLLDPGGPDGVTVYNTRIGNARNISISFHDNVFDRRVLDGAAGFLRDPMRFLG
jgi:hypothetical protein